MAKLCIAVLFLLVSSLNSVLAQDTIAAPVQNPMVIVHTSMGDFTFELYPGRAPKSVANFLQYVRDDFYSGTVFHRVINDFMIQGGGFDRSFVKKPVRDPVENEADNNIPNERGTVAMARTADPHSTTSQFFFNVH